MDSADAIERVAAAEIARLNREMRALKAENARLKKLLEGAAEGLRDIEMTKSADALCRALAG